MWLACHGQDEIAAEVEWPRQTISDWIHDFADFANLSKSGKTLASHADENFIPPIYNVWKRRLPRGVTSSKRTAGG